MNDDTVYNCKVFFWAGPLDASAMSVCPVKKKKKKKLSNGTLDIIDGA